MDLNSAYVQTFIRDILIPYIFENAPHADLIALSRTCKRLYRTISRWLTIELTKPQWSEFPSKRQFRDHVKKGAYCVIARWIDLGYTDREYFKYLCIDDKLSLVERALYYRQYQGYDDMQLCVDTRLQCDAHRYNATKILAYTLNFTECGTTAYVLGACYGIARAKDVNADKRFQQYLDMDRSWISEGSLAVYTIVRMGCKHANMFVVDSMSQMLENEDVRTAAHLGAARSGSIDFYEKISKKYHCM